MVHTVCRTNHRFLAYDQTKVSGGYQTTVEKSSKSSFFIHFLNKFSIFSTESPVNKYFLNFWISNIHWTKYKSRGNKILTLCQSSILNKVVCCGFFTCKKLWCLTWEYRFNKQIEVWTQFNSYTMKKSQFTQIDAVFE